MKAETWPRILRLAERCEAPCLALDVAVGAGRMVSDINGLQDSLHNWVNRYSGEAVALLYGTAYSKATFLGTTGTISGRLYRLHFINRSSQVLTAVVFAESWNYSRIEMHFSDTTPAIGFIVINWNHSSDAFQIADTGAGFSTSTGWTRISGTTDSFKLYRVDEWV